MSSQQPIQAIRESNAISMWQEEIVIKSNSLPKEKFDTKQKIEISNEQFKSNKSQFQNSNKMQCQSFLAKPDKIAALLFPNSTTHQANNLQLNEFPIFSKDEILIYQVHFAEEEETTKNQQINNSLNLRMNDFENKNNLCQEIQEKNQLVKQFKRDTQHLIEVVPSEQKITQHLYLKIKPNPKQICFIKIVPNQKQCDNQKTVQIKTINEKQDLIHVLTQQFTKNSQGIELDVNKLGNKQLLKDLQNKKSTLFRYKQINVEYLKSQQRLQNEIKDLKDKVQNIQKTNLLFQSPCFQQSSKISSLDTSKIFEQLSKYKDFITWSKLQHIQQIQSLNQQYLTLQKNNKQLEQYKTNLINKILNYKCQQREFNKAKSSQQLQYQRHKQSLQKQITIERKKYDLFKHVTRKNSSRLSDSRMPSKRFKTSINIKQNTFSKRLLGGIACILIIVIIYNL